MHRHRHQPGAHADVDVHLHARVKRQCSSELVVQVKACPDESLVRRRDTSTWAQVAPSHLACARPEQPYCSHACATQARRQSCAFFAQMEPSKEEISHLRRRPFPVGRHPSTNNVRCRYGYPGRFQNIAAYVHTAKCSVRQRSRGSLSSPSALTCSTTPSRSHHKLGVKERPLMHNSRCTSALGRRRQCAYGRRIHCVRSFTWARLVTTAHPHGVSSAETVRPV